MKQYLSTISPQAIKKTYRLVRYKNERKKYLRERHIRKAQNTDIRNLFDSEAEKLIVFVVQGADWETGKDKISGGAMSITSICEETANVQHIHQSETIMVTMNQEHLLLEHTQFENRTKIFRFDQLAGFFKNVQDIIIHIPEFLVSRFCETLSKKDKVWIDSMKNVHFNIMNQNIRLMPSPDQIQVLKRFGNKVTITTAHQQYCSPHFRSFYAVPIHKFSVWISPEQYKFVPWHLKENLMVVSPDKHSLRDGLLAKLQLIEGLTVTVIQNLKYQEYKELISRAKWSLTFGEGLDGYLIEPVFSGAIGFAAYNKDFFTSDFEGLPSIYPDMETLLDRISVDIMKFDKEEIYRQFQHRLFEVCATHYSQETYRRNIAAFYIGQYTYA